VKKFIIPT